MPVGAPRPLGSRCFPAFFVLPKREPGTRRGVAQEKQRDETV